MRKSQQFFVFKLSSSRITKANYNIEINIDAARKNAELISIAQNQVILSILKIKNKRFDSNYLETLIDNRKEIRKLESCPENIEELIVIEDAINDILFIPEIISLYVDSKKQYQKIIAHGFKVNGIEFTRLLCGAGHSRRNTVIFCAKHIEDELKTILNNGRRIDPMVLAKNNAYFALAYSGVIPVSQPYFCVVPDCEIKRDTKVEFIEDNGEISERAMELPFNLFDGQGLISPQMAKKWAKDLQIDYVPGAFIIRNAFLKGLVATFDFHAYSEEVVEKHIIKDVWGNDVNIRDMDIIFTASQFKAWQSYNSLNEYQKNCEKNEFHFGVVRVAPEQDKTVTTTNYQFLQAFDLDDAQIESLCSKTVKFFDKTINSDWVYSVIYLMGTLADVEYNDTIFDSINDIVTKALILNNDLINDPYIKNYLVKSLNKKIRESYVGSLIVDGNYSFILQDPYAFCQYIFKEPITGLLDEWQHYSGFWNKRNIFKVAAMRAPLTWRSEVNILNFVDNKKTDKWYKYLKNGCIVHNIHGVDMMMYADGDADGDLIMTTDQQENIEGTFGGLPIAFSRKTAKREPVIEDKLWKIDLLSMDSKIGYITNCSTTLYAMQASYEADSPKYIEIEKRLKLCRQKQGDQIDSTKGIEVDPFPVHWTQYSKTNEGMSKEEIEQCNFNNSIRINKRPYFFRYRYSDWNKKFKNYNNAYDNYCQYHAGKFLEDVLDNPQTKQERNIIKKYRKYSPLLDSNCVVNRICHHMENTVKIIKYDARENVEQSNTLLLKTSTIETDKSKLKKMRLLYKEFKVGKKDFSKIRNDRGEKSYRTLEQYNLYIRNKAMKISSNIQELANLAVDICYELHPSDSNNFVWSVFNEGLLLNILENKQEECFIPLINESGGDILYLGKRYSLKKIDVEKKVSNFDY